MKLIYRIALRLSLLLLPLLALWAALFYYTMIDEINDEADDALDDYSELIIVRMLSGRELPALNNGSNNSYSIVPVNEAYVETHPRIHYRDAEVYIPEKEETEPARILTTLFQDRDGHFYKLTVATPTFEKGDLFRAILYWIIFLYLLLLLTVLGSTVWVFHRTLRPLYALLQWLDEYTPGQKNAAVPADTTIPEFHRLCIAAQQAANRTEELFERQKQFIGNASHELQTPLAILGNRLEWLLDNGNPSEEQLGELIKMQRTLSHVVRLNRTLLLLTKIENGQFPESTDIDIAGIVQEQLPFYEEIYASRGIVCTTRLAGPLGVRMNESMATILVTNLLKNAYVHTSEEGHVEVVIQGRRFEVRNDGSEPLDADHIFDRFYQGKKKEGSTGLGLALVSAVGRYYGLRVAYRFVEGRHCFTVVWP